MSGPAPSSPPADDGLAAHLGRGALLPDIALPSTLGGEVNLGTRPGAAIVYVYPWTGRPGLPDPPGWDDIAGAHGSTPETAGFRDHYASFQSFGVDVFGLSGQDTAHQRELSDRLGVPFALLSDAEFRLQKALRLPTFDAGGTPYLKRLTLYVREARIGHVFYPVHPPEAHAAEVLAWLAAGGAPT
jgi:peroxiredoxin